MARRPCRASDRRGAPVWRARSWARLLRTGSAHPCLARARLASRDIGRRETMTTIDFELEQPGAALEHAAVLALGLSAESIATVLKTPAQEAQGLLDAETTFAGTHPQCRQSRAASFAASSPRSTIGLLVIGSYRGAKMANVDQERRR